MTDVPKIEDIVAFSIDYLCGLFSGNDVVEHSGLFNAEKELIEKFNLNNGLSLQCLFRPIYWYFKDNYGVSVRDKDPKSDKFYWALRDGLPDKKEFKKGVLKKNRTYLEFHLQKAQASS